jgi:hypothetical protein
MADRAIRRVNLQSGSNVIHRRRRAGGFWCFRAGKKCAGEWQRKQKALHHFPV